VGFARTWWPYPAMRTKIIPIAAASALSLALAAACSPPATETAAANGANPACFKRSSDVIGGPFQLTASDGRVMTEKDFAGRKALVFFGYTYCPDICPITLFNVGKAMADIPEDKRPVTLFVSVDP